MEWPEKNPGFVGSGTMESQTIGQLAEPLGAFHQALVPEGHSSIFGHQVPCDPSKDRVQVACSGGKEFGRRAGTGQELHDIDAKDRRWQETKGAKRK